MAALTEEGDDRALVSLHMWLGIRDDFVMRYGPAQRSYRRALEHLDRCEDRRLELDLLTWCIGPSLFLGPVRVSEAMAFIERVLGGALGQSHLELLARGTLAALLTMSGELERGRRMIDAVMARLRELDVPWRESNVGQLAGGIELLADRPAAAVRRLVESYEIGERIGDQGGRWTTAAMAGEALRLDGKAEEAERWCDLAARHAPENDVATHVQVHVTRASIRAGSGDVPAALEHAAAAAHLASATDSPEIRADVAEATATALAADRRRDEVATTLDTAIAGLEGKENVARARQLRRLRRELYA
jgi:hypothetical protein